jgi:hypothetical protein
MYLGDPRTGNEKTEFDILAEQSLGATFIPTQDEEIETGCWDTSAEKFKYDPEYQDANRSRDEDW